MGMMNFRIAFVVVAAANITVPAFAASTSWHEAAGGRVRLVTAGPVDAKGELRGALQIDLKPGWKTYWRDPGASGVPPEISLAPDGGWKSATIEFPAPQWHKDDYGRWAGYDYPVSLPVILRSDPGASPQAVSGSVFLGICETICVPLQAPISLEVDATGTPSADNAVVEAAWTALPKPASPEFGVSKVEAVSPEKLAITVTTPAPASEMFVAGEQGYVLAPPKLDGDGRFLIHVVARPKAKPEGPGLPYTLTTPGGAVSGFIAYP